MKSIFISWLCAFVLAVVGFGICQSVADQILKKRALEELATIKVERIKRETINSSRLSSNEQDAKFGNTFIDANSTKTYNDERIAVKMGLIIGSALIASGAVVAAARKTK
jgi:hypothetical protein